MESYEETLKKEYFLAKKKAGTYKIPDYLNEHILAPLFKKKYFARFYSFFERRFYLSELRKEKGWTEKMKKNFLVGIKIRQDANSKAAREKRRPEYDIFNYADKYSQHFFEQEATAKVIKEHFQDRMRRSPAKEGEEIHPLRPKESGDAAGYIARYDRFPGTEYMVKSVDLTSSLETKIDFIKEYVFGELFRRVLHEYAPLISAVERSGSVQGVALRAEFLEGFETFEQFIDIKIKAGEKKGKIDPKKMEDAKKRAKAVQGVAKVVAAVLFFGEEDWHRENIGVVKKSDGQLVLAKIDHGKACSKIFNEPVDVMGHLSNEYINRYGYNQFLSLSAKELKDALDETMGSLTDEAIVRIVRVRMNELNEMFRPRVESEGGKKQRIELFQFLERQFIEGLKKQRKVMEKFSQWLGDIDAVDVPPGYLKKDSARVTKWKNGGWLEVIGKNPEQWIRQQQQQELAEHKPLPSKKFQPHVFTKRWEMLNSLLPSGEEEAVDASESGLLPDSEEVFSKSEASGKVEVHEPKWTKKVNEKSGKVHWEQESPKKV